MEELVKEISAKMAVLDKDMNNNVKGNKAAGARARKVSLELERLFKEYRKKSIESDKK